MSTPTPPPPSGTPRPRRIRLDAAGWSLVRTAAAEQGLDVSRLPSVGEAAVDTRVREELAASDVVDGSGRLTRVAYGGIAVLTTAPLTLSVEHLTRDRALQGTWRSLGIPTAGVVIHDEQRDGKPWREIELQVLSGDDLVDLALETLDVGGTTDTSTSDPVDSEAPEDAAFWGRDPGFEVRVGAVDDLPDGVLIDGEFVARATLSIAGPTRTSVAQLVGDGTRWWQVAATDAETVRWISVETATVRRALVSAIAAELTLAGDSRE